MRQLQKLLILILALGLVTWAVSDVAWAQGRGRIGGGTGTGTGAFQYVVKFVCAPTDAETGHQDVAPGFYFTDVNIHNPNDRIVKFRKKIALDGFEPQRHGLQTSPVDVTLGPDEALEINCNDIIRLLFGPGSSVSGAIAGFVVLYSKVKLDVSAIYTACPGSGCSAEVPGEGISTIQVDELIPPSPVAAPAVFIRGLAASSAGVDLSVQPFSPLAYDGARLMIYDQNGKQLHDSGFTSGTQLRWRPLSAGKPLANGVYFYVVAVRDVLGQVSYKAGKFALLR